MNERRALRVAAALLLAGGAFVAWWVARGDGMPRIELPAARAMTEKSLAPQPSAPAGVRTPDEVVAPPSMPQAPQPSLIAAASPLLLPDRVVVVSGVIVAAEGGAPIAGAEVVLRGDGWGRVDGEAETDERGRYEVRLEGGVPARMRIRTEAEGFSFGETRLDVAPDATELRADFRLRKGFEVAVEVVRALDGAPIPFATVQLYQDGLRLDALHDGKTDGAGRWVERGVVDLPRRDLAVLVDAEDFAILRVTPLALPDDGDRLELRCDLSPSRSLTGIVVAQGGDPMAGASVWQVSKHDDFQRGRDLATCDESGRFTLVPYSFPEELTTLVVTTEESSRRVGLDRPWAVDGGSVTIVLPGPVAQWRGRVVELATGRGVVGGRIFTRQRGMADRRMGASMWVDEDFNLDSEGRFEIPIAALPTAGTIELEVDATDCMSRSIELPLPLGGGPALPPVIEVERAVTIRGRVLDAASRQPLIASRANRPQVHVTFERAGTDESRAVDHGFRSLDESAREDGSYRVDLPRDLARMSGCCSLVVEHEGRRIAMGRLDLRPYLDRSAPGTRVEITVDLPIDVSPLPLGEPK